MLGSTLSRFIAASGLTNLGDGIATLAWAWVATLLTRDPMLIAAVPVALRLPWPLLALVAGVVTDRVDRRRLILAMDILRTAGFAGVALALLLALPLPPAPAEGLASVPAFAALMIAALLVGSAEVFRDNAAQTMLPALVPPARLEQANGRLWSVELIGNALIGPALGALLIGAFVPLPFAVNALCYGCAALILWRIAGSFRPAASGAPRHWRRELAEGLAFLRAAPLLRTLAWLTGLWNLFFQMVMVALLLHAQENLGIEAEAYGLILAAGALGGIAGGLLGERVVRALGPARTAQWMLLASAPTFAAIALVPGPWALALVMVSFEFTGLVWNTVSVSTRQRMIPDALLGRVNAIYRLLAWGMIPLGLVLSGLTMRLLDGPLPRAQALEAPFWIAAAGTLLTAALGWGALGRGFAAQARARGR